MVASAVTKGFFNTNLYEFLTGQTGSKHGYGFDGSTVLSLPELLGVGDRIPFGGRFAGAEGVSDNLASVLKTNFNANWFMMTASVIGIPVVFNIAKKMLRKPVINPANRILKQIGMTGVKL